MNRLLVALGLFLVTTVGSAQELGRQSGGYFGFQLGQFDYEEDASILAPGLTLKDEVLATGLYGGYRFNESWGIEASLGETDDMQWGGSGFDPVDLGNYTVNLIGSYEIVTLHAMYHSGPFLLGMGYYDSELSGRLDVFSSFLGNGSIPFDGSEDGVTLKIGGEWDVGNKVGMRGAIDLYDTESTVDAYTLSLGIHLKF